MEEKENYGFCPSCGAMLPENSAFCPECGRSVGGESAPHENVGYGYSRVSEMDSPKNRLKGKLLVAFIFILIYAVMSIFGAISLLTINEATIDSFNEMMADSGGDSFEDILKSAGLDMTESEFIDFCKRSGIVSLISGVLAGVAAFLIGKHMKRMIATIIVVIAALVNFVLIMDAGVFNTIINVVIGCIMAYLVYSSPEGFADE